MTLPRGKIVKGPVRGATSVPIAPRDQRPARLLKASEARASMQAAVRIAAAEEQARAIQAEAEETARTLRDQARDEGRQEGVAELVAAWVKLRTEQNARDERDLDRLTELARAIAERLLGESLGLDPTKVASIARQALAFARQSRRVSVRAHPTDAEVLGRHIASLGLEQAALEIHADPTRPRGSLLLDTDLGTLDANLTIQLDRLARSLRDSFRS